MSKSAEITVRPDAKGRITLGKLAEGLSGFKVTKNSDGSFHLLPLKEIPEREMWLYRNPEAMAAVLEGLEDSKAGRVHDLGSFAHYLED